MQRRERPAVDWSDVATAMESEIILPLRAHLRVLRAFAVHPLRVNASGVHREPRSIRLSQQHRLGHQAGAEAQSKTGSGLG